MKKENRMDRILAVALAIVMLLGVFAAVAEDAPQTEPAAEQQVQPVKEEQQAEPVKEEPKAEPAKEEPQAEPVKDEPKAEPAKEEPQAEPVKEEPKQEKPAKKGFFRRLFGKK